MSFWKTLFFRKKNKVNPVVNDVFSLKLIKLVDFIPNNISLFKEALTHKSYKNFTEDSINFERLEFLGDSVINLVVANFLFDSVPDQKEGYLTQMRSKIVKRKHLNEVGKNLNLLNYIRRDCRATLGSDVLGDVYEALVGAIFLDQGYKKAEDFISKTIFDKLEINNLENQISSYKSLLLECSQKQKFEINFNTFLEENAQDITVFVSILRYNNKVIAKGRATSKKKAEENAAKRAYYSLKNTIC
jgi:ribonuclease-3